MISKLFNFFKFKKGVPFDPKLIAEFNQDHKNLVKLALEIKQLAENETSPLLIKNQLKTLKVEILVHFLHEEKTLYKYLNALYKNDEDNRELVEDFNQSMHKIQSQVENFMETYTSSYAKYDEKFISDFNGVVLLLAKRIETEEKYLYSLYNEKIKTIGSNEFSKIK